MRLATARLGTGTVAVRIQGGASAVELGEPDVGTLLAREDWAEHAATHDGPFHPLGELTLAPVVPRPGKIFCVGLNYRDHILEMDRELPSHPTLFGKFAESLIGPTDDIELPAESSAVDWEVELVAVIGRTVRRATPEQAADAIAGYTVGNDVSVRDWQNRTGQFLQGKTFEATTPLGPVLVTADEIGNSVGYGLALSTEVDGEVMQSSDTSQLLFDPVELVGYISTILTLRPGDVIFTGTPGGVGHARKPPRYLTDGATLVSRIDGIGELTNVATS